jgi:hypothetical protein
MIKYIKQSYFNSESRIIKVGEVLDFGKEQNEAIVKQGFAEFVKIETKPKKDKLETK